MAIVMTVTMVACAPVASAEPSPTYVSCPGGYIAHNLGECPPYPRPPIGITGHGGGAGNGGGILGTIGRVLGGLTGGLL